MGNLICCDIERECKQENCKEISNKRYCFQHRCMVANCHDKRLHRYTYYCDKHIDYVL